MRILKLEAENFKRLSAVEITPKGDVIKVTGANAQGKSSVLDAIWVALGGGAAQPDAPIRRGAERAKVTLDLGDLIVERRFTAKSSELVVSNKDGARFPSPQKMLDNLVGRLTFDPLEFMRLEPKRQGEILRQLAGIDFAQLDRDRKAAYDERTIVNRKVEDLHAQGSAISVPLDAPDAEEDPGELLDEIRRGQDQNADNEGVRDAAGRARIALQDAERSVAEAEQVLERAKAREQAARATLDKAQAAVEALIEIDVAPARARLDNIKARNEAARAKLKRRELGRQYREAQGIAEELSKRITAIDLQKAQDLANAKYPVPGLGLDGEGTVTFNGLPLAQASSAEQLKVSVAMAMALNPKLRVLRITDGSLLDSSSMATIEAMAREHDYQCWIEAVDESGKVGLVIQDGKVAVDNQVAAAA